MVIRGVVFDMDDTLYDERDYVRSGFAAVACAAGRSDEETRRFADWLWAAFEAGIRGDTFDRLRAAFPDLALRISSGALVEVYRTHVPGVRLAATVEATLDRLHAHGLRLGILTDGPVASQSAKVAALGLERWFDPILLTGSADPTFAKPGTAGFASIAEAWALAGSELVYVADNPEKDFVGPRRLGWMTIRLSHPGQLRHTLAPVDDTHRPDVVIDDLGALTDMFVSRDRP